MAYAEEELYNLYPYKKQPGDSELPLPYEELKEEIHFAAVGSIKKHAIHLAEQSHKEISRMLVKNKGFIQNLEKQKKIVSQLQKEITAIEPENYQIEKKPFTRINNKLLRNEKLSQFPIFMTLFGKLQVLEKKDSYEKHAEKATRHFPNSPPLNWRENTIDKTLKSIFYPNEVSGVIDLAKSYIKNR